MPTRLYANEVAVSDLHSDSDTYGEVQMKITDQSSGCRILCAKSNAAGSSLATGWFIGGHCVDKIYINFHGRMSIS